MLFPKKEPLRYKLREVAVDFLSKVLASKNPMALKTDFKLIQTFISIAKNQNWVSPKELDEILSGYGKILEEINQRENQNFSFNDRQKKILEILKEKERLQIWQLKDYFPNISKRTLRRDLVKLVQAGLVLRTGEISNTYYQLNFKNE
ncbi:DeoR family transcriptional regulator [Candidatus Parcubacteria bacterium]|nr:DeoR family transcriptional regulator [Candidatus Parcubacteria bacterium]